MPLVEEMLQLLPFIKYTPLGYLEMEDSPPRVEDPGISKELCRLSMRLWR